MLMVLCDLGWHFGVKSYLPQVQWLLYGMPVFPAQMALALSAGWILGGALPHRATLWVWVLPSVALCFALAGVALAPAPPPAYILFPPINELTITQAASLAFASRLSHFFGRGAGIQPYNQVVATVPLYCAVAYSVGAWLASNAIRTPGFFQTVRRLRKMRLLLLVALPWFCVRLAVDWRQASAQYPALRTWPVLRAALVGLAMASVFVAFVFALAVGVVGRRLSLTRFFLSAAQPEGEDRPGQA
jgi:hypothetical protein